MPDLPPLPPLPPRLPSIELSWEDAACGLLLTDLSGRILRVNRTLCTWLGHGVDELVGTRSLQDLLTMGARIFHQTHWAPLLQLQGSIAEVKVDLRCRDGRSIPVMLNALRRVYEGTPFDEIAVFVAEDRNKYEQELLRARRAAEELLRKEHEAQEALASAQAQLIADAASQRAAAEDRALFAEQMMGIVSHDMRNPLSVVSLSAHVLARSALDDTQSQAVVRIRTATARANRLIADLLDFTQARLGGGIVVRRRPIQLHALVQDCVHEVSAAYPDRALTHARSGEGECTGDADRLTQLLGNLISNAMTYGDPGEPVAVTSSIEAEVFTISVHNGGEPMADAVLATLFEPMVRGPGVKTVGRSIGLGLYIVREIASAHGGTVSASSTASEGTTFVTAFPRSTPA